MENHERKNEPLQALIQDLKKKAIETESPLFKRLASELEAPTRSRRVINLSKINGATEQGEVIVVPGKVLGTGDLDHAVTVYAYQYSSSAVAKLAQKKTKPLSIQDLLKENIKGKSIRIIG